MVSSGTILVSFDNQHGDDHAVLIVGQKRPNQSVEIVNAFEGADAIELWNRLTTKKENHDA